MFPYFWRNSQDPSAKHLLLASLEQKKLFQKISVLSERCIQNLLNADFFAVLLVMTDDSFNESGLRSWDRLRGRLRVLLRGRIAAGPLSPEPEFVYHICVRHVSLCLIYLPKNLSSVLLLHPVF